MRLLPLLLPVTGLCIGCSSAPLSSSPSPFRPDLGELYSEAAKIDGLFRNPVIVIPGILGSRLVDARSGTVVWGAFDGGYADPRDPEGRRLVALPMKLGADLDELEDLVIPDGALRKVDVKFLGLPFSGEAYAQILDALGIGGFRDKDLGQAGAVDYGDAHYTCFQFDYDWRLDLVQNARRLDDFIEVQRSYVRGQLEERFGIKNADVHFDIVTHSMGGLLARYYLRYGRADLPGDGLSPAVTWEGAKFVDRLVMVAPPNAGSAHAFTELVEGSDLPFVLPDYPPAVLGTMPAIYQLLPRARHGFLVDASDPSQRLDNALDPKLWQEMGWGLADPSQDEVLADLLPEVSDPAERRRIALDHQRKCLERAEHIALALDQDATPPSTLEIFLVAGDAIPTARSIAVDRSNGDVWVAATGPGDGKVLRSSALMDERAGGQNWPRLVSPIALAGVLFLFTDHRGITNDPVFVDNLLYLLLVDPRRGTHQDIRRFLSWSGAAPGANGEREDRSLPSS